MTLKLKKIQPIITLILLLWFSFFVLEKIDLTTADLGRHIKNGEIIFNFNEQSSKVLNTNFYSYTHPDFPFLNHHWGGGVIFFLTWQAFGFYGLSILNLLLNIIIFLLFFDIAKKESNFKIAAITAFFLTPLLADRTEVRPEIFSYLFIALFFWILWHYKKEEISKKWLYLIPLIELLWTNIHIYFFLGLIVVGVFLLEQVFLFFRKRKNYFKEIFLVSISSLLATLVNPFGIKTILYPFKIFNNYGYKIVENQSVWFLENLGATQPNINFFEIVFTLLALSFLILIIKNKKISISHACFAAGFSLMAWLAIRNFSTFAFFALVVLASNLNKIFPKSKKEFKDNYFIGSSLLIMACIFLIYHQSLPFYKDKLGFGLMEKNNKSIEWLKENNVQGPILNNYDVGSFLDFHLHPEEKVFVDNRPEAFPSSFFQDIYIPLQQNQEIFKEQDKKYNFNVIFFSHRDYTPWGQKFLISLIDNREWTPVFVDQYVIIFLRNNKDNQTIIEENAIPRSNFNVVQ